MHWQVLRHKPRDLNPLHWLTIAQRLRHAASDLRNAAANLAALGSFRTRGAALHLAEHCEEAITEAERIAKRLGA